MNLIVKSGIGRYTFYNEQHVLVGQVKKSLWSEKTLTAWDCNGNLVSTIACEKENFTLLEGGKKCRCLLSFQKDQNGCALQAFTRPPAPKKLSLDAPWGTLSITQTTGREFEIFLNQEKVGEIKHMMSLTKEIRILSDRLPFSFYCAVFSLGFFMLHHDDVDIV